jgi:glycosyltransferase involved in cell wall biosynthesis
MVLIKSSEIIIFAKRMVQKMKIVVNTRLVLKGKMDGIGWFTWETMPKIAEQHPEHQFYFLFDRPYDPSFRFPANVTPIVIRPVARHPALIRFWNNYAVTQVLKRLKPDLYLSPDFFLPQQLPCPGIVIIHDLNFEHFPDFLPAPYRKLYQTSVRRSARLAARILTVSEFSRQDMMQQYAIPPEIIDVVYCGVGSHIRKVSADNILKVKQHFGIDGNYLIVPGTIHPRKNTANTIRAYEEFRKGEGCSEKLVFAGNNKWFSPEMKQALEHNRYRNDIHFTGRVSDHEMSALISGAKAMVFASLFEGFGIPILEAASAGIPLLTSDNSSMKEIAGDSALLVDPTDHESIAAGMQQITQDQQLRAALLQKSIHLPDQYSWDKTANLIWESVAGVLGIGKPPSDQPT